MVAGNNDFFCDLPREDEFEIGKYRVLLTHGHYYYISMGTEMLKEEAGRGISISPCSAIPTGLIWSRSGM